MPENEIQQLKLDVANAAQDAFRKQGLEIRLRKGFGDRIEAREVAQDLAIETASNLLFTHVKRALRRRGIHCYGLIDERGSGDVDFVFHFSNSNRQVRLGMAFQVNF